MSKVYDEATTERILGLPKWAQQYVAMLRRDRDEALKLTAETLDGETQSPVYVDEWTMDCFGMRGTKRRYFQMHHNLIIEHAGIVMRVVLRDDSLTVQYEDESRMTWDVNMQPTSHQAFALKRIESIE